MNELVAKETMTSKEIAEITGKQHAHVMRDIRALLEQGVSESNFGLSSYKQDQPNGGSKDVPMYLLTKKGCLILASGYDAVLREKIINRWEELELKERQKFQVPTTFAEALRLAAEQQEQIEAQQKLIEVQTPKAEFYDEVVDSKDAIDMQAVAKVINMGIGRNKLFEFLRNNKVLMQNNQPYQYYIDLGWYRVIESKYTKPSGDICINLKPVVFQKGVDGIRKLIKQNKHKNNKQ